MHARWGDGLIGRFVAAATIDDNPRSQTTAWAVGAAGEERVAAMLDSVETAVTLHDRRIPGSRANIDHIFVSPRGVWVVDAKKYVGKRPRLSHEGGVFGFGGTERLRIAGRASDRLVDGVLGQARLVTAALGHSVPVSAALCFVDADWPLLGGAFTVQGVFVGSPKMLRKRLIAQEGDEPVIDVDWASARLARMLPPA